MNKVYDFLLKVFFVIGLYTKRLKNNKNYIFISDKESIENIKVAFKNKNLLIVSNHMTLLDSVLIQLFLFEIFGWLSVIKNNFRQIVWNLPAIENLDLLRSNTTNVSKFIYLKIGRMIPIDRSNQDSSMKTLEKVSNLICKKNVFLIFPEASRTRREQFSEEDVTPGAAKVMLDCEKNSGILPGLLTIYIRAENQFGHSNLPMSDKIKIYADFSDSFPISSDQSQIRKRKNLTIFIGNKIKILQEKYVNSNR
jgi:1-acyl-sn-glycerol-3-phosphate acyltransferase